MNILIPTFQIRLGEAMGIIDLNSVNFSKIINHQYLK